MYQEENTRGAGPQCQVALLRRLDHQRGMLCYIFAKTQNKITNPGKLLRLIDMVVRTDCVMLRADVNGDIYEGLLERNPEDTKSGAGQYLTAPCAQMEYMRSSMARSKRSQLCSMRARLLS